jgi:hypothetical protein
MSNNLLGKDENLNAVQPDFVTGGESLSELLSNPSCPLQTLNVSKSAKHFCSTLTIPFCPFSWFVPTSRSLAVC